MNLARRLILPALALLVVASCGSESDPSAKPTPSTSATPRADVEVRDAVFVLNDDGSATLSARIVNHTAENLEVSNVAVEDDSYPAEGLRWFRPTNRSIAADATTTAGHESDPVRIRLMDAGKPGDTFPFLIEFMPLDNYTEDTTTVRLKVPVVARAAEYEDIVGNGPNTAIKAIEAKVVVIPGQKKAYVGGSLTGTITDHAWTLPTAVGADGRPVRYRHQTATGGPYGMMVEAGKTIPFGGPPYTEGEGDADYFDADDVTVGETITVTIPFQSGDVIVPFKVVAG